MDLLATGPGPRIHKNTKKKGKRKTSWEKSRQRESKLCLKVCFGVERALAGPPLRRVPSLHIWVKLGPLSFSSHTSKLYGNKRSEPASQRYHSPCASPTSCCGRSLVTPPTPPLTFQVSASVQLVHFFRLADYTLHSSCGTSFLSRVVGVHLAGLLKGISDLQVLSECVSGRGALLFSLFFFPRHLRRIWAVNLKGGENVLPADAFPPSSSGFDPSCFRSPLRRSKHPSGRSAKWEFPICLFFVDRKASFAIVFGLNGGVFPP